MAGNPLAWSGALSAEHAGMHRVLACLLACLALLTLSACGSQAERNETRDDLRRFRQARGAEVEQIKRDLARFGRVEASIASEIPHDAAAFFAWRHREWRRLQDDLAVLIAYEWETIEQLTLDAARFYGYEIRNFPKLTKDIAIFFEYADFEWAGLVRDVAMFVEWQDREWLPLRRELREAYERLGWEAGNLQVDLLTFLQWREREWRRLVSTTDHFMSIERTQGQRMREDLRRFRAARALEANYLVADLKQWWAYEAGAMPPRLIADVYRWAQLPPQEITALGNDIVRFGEGIHEDTLKLIDDLGRFANHQIDLLPALIADVDRFFIVYERECGPLGADVRRWWRSNIGLGILLREDLRIALIENPREDAAELQASMRRFVSYAGKEWKDFKGALGRFLHDDSGRAFGDRSMPMAGDSGRAVFEDPRAYPARGYDAGEE